LLEKNGLRGDVYNGHENSMNEEVVNVE